MLSGALRLGASPCHRLIDADALTLRSVVQDNFGTPPLGWLPTSVCGTAALGCYRIYAGAHSRGRLCYMLGFSNSLGPLDRCA